MGEGKIWAVPPRPTNLNLKEDDVLDWEGEVQCSPDVAVGGFKASNVLVKDYIVVSVASPANSPYSTTKINVPIRIVTDTWTSSGQALS